MTKEEAVAFLRRNPKIADRLQYAGEDFIIKHMDAIYWPVDVTNDADARVNVCKVILALRGHRDEY